MYRAFIHALGWGGLSAFMVSLLALCAFGIYGIDSPFPTYAAHMEACNAACAGILAGMGGAILAGILASIRGARKA
jgi:hypothetical protein